VALSLHAGYSTALARRSKRREAAEIGARWCVTNM
jgi:hypothetical protein